MTDKALISELTWRSLEMQKEAFPDMPHFIAPDEMQWLMRESTRNTSDRIHVVSLGVIADSEKDFREFLALAKKRKAQIISREDNQTFIVNGNCENLVKWWKDARRNGAAKIGAKISADNKKEFARKGIELIRADWPKPSSEVSTGVLKERSGLSLNTIKKYLGPRPIAQYNYRTKHGKQVKQMQINPEPREEMDFCGVYVFQIERGTYKVGVSGDARRRFKDVSQYHKKQMKVVELFNMDLNKAYAVEAEVHSRLRKHLATEYRGREIFKVSLETIKRTVKRAINTISKGITYE